MVVFLGFITVYYETISLSFPCSSSGFSTSQQSYLFKTHEMKGEKYFAVFTPSIPLEFGKYG